ncbi:hypothetical protein LB542_19875 [Mesorhizobium sp. BR1-1-9]|uniref:hypothetical protein n=1 Tax=Mesorhizobium sp. BR1-1-9 TaxID=2876646 RepID=UPI001CD0A110|nr:hypothetical protein [Mesorhizobium sp. BR1-1-9]MBZ9873110.1 hypothetical protein [Mesorhizobium sp. BR1-1-9]
MEHLLTEPAIVSDIFCSGLADAEDLGDGNYRFTLYARQKSHQDYAGGVDFVIVARLIMPAPAVVQSIQMTMKAMNVSCCGAERLRVAH